jgi:hypothetical protein
MLARETPGRLTVSGQIDHRKFCIYHSSLKLSNPHAGLPNDKRNVHASLAGTVSGHNYRSNSDMMSIMPKLSGAPQLMTEQRSTLSRFFPLILILLVGNVMLLT